MTKTTAQARTINARPVSLLTHLTNGIRLARQRRQLARLDANALCDMGITRAQVCAEARRLAWDAPKNWRS